MKKPCMLNKNKWPRLLMLSVLTMIAMCLVSAYGACSECEMPNPDYDPTNPYETDPECIPKADGTACGQVLCCYGGNCEPPKCYSLEPRFWPNCFDTGGVPECDNGSCAPKVECLITHYTEAVLSCSGSQSYTAGILAAKRTTICRNEWDYQKLLAVATSAGVCGVSCYACYQAGGGLVTECAGCWACIIGAGIGITSTELCDYMTDCAIDPNATPVLSYITTHVLTGGSCP